MRLWPTMFALATACTIITTPTLAIDDGDLRRSLREAGMIPYFSFKPAADFSYPDITTGRPFSLADLKGRVVLVNVWATWCPPCVREMPSLQALHEALHRRGLVVVGVNVRDRKSAPAVAQWLTERNLTFPNVKASDDGPNFPSGFRVPQTFLIDRRGRLIANKAGAADWADTSIRVIVEALLDTSSDEKGP